MKRKMKIDHIRYDINTPRPRHVDKYSKYKNCFSMMMLVCFCVAPKQNLKFNSWKS